MKLRIVTSSGKTGTITVPDTVTRQTVLAIVRRQLPEGTKLSSIERIKEPTSTKDPSEFKGEVPDEAFALEADVSDVPVTERMESGEAIDRASQMIGALPEPGTDPRVKEKAIQEAQSGLTVLGRGIGAGIDVGTTALGDVISTQDSLAPLSDYTKQFSETYNLPYEERNIGGQILADPALLPSMVVPAAGAKYLGQVASKIPYASKTPALGKAFMTGATEGGVDAALQAAAGAEDVSPEGVGLSVLLGGTMQPAAQKLGDIAFQKWTDVIPNALWRDMPEWKKTQSIAPTYEGLSTPISPLGDYDYQQRLRDLSTETSKLGAVKEKAIGEAEEVVSLFPNAQRDIVSGAGDNFDNEIVNAVEQINMGGSGADEAARYLSALNDVKSNYLMDVNIEVPTEVSVESALEAIEAGKAGATEWQSNLSKMFETRKTMDKELTKAYKRAGQGKSIPEKDQAIWFGRSFLNDRIDETINTIDDRLAAQLVLTPNYTKAIEAKKQLNKLKKELEKTKELPSLYKQAEVLQSLGGGRAKKSSASMFSPSVIKESLLPVSGVRERQVSEALTWKPGQALGRDLGYQLTSD